MCLGPLNIKYIFNILFFNNLGDMANKKHLIKA